MDEYENVIKKLKEIGEPNNLISARKRLELFILDYDSFSSQEWFKCLIEGLNKLNDKLKDMEPIKQSSGIKFERYFTRDLR